MGMGYDVIGNIAILPLYSKNTKKIANMLLKQNPNIKSVYAKAEKVKGRLRKRKLKFLAGEKTKETIHKESGCYMKLDVEECYFSPRLSNDRLEIARKVRKSDKVLVMFSGIAPYALVIAKNAKPKIVYAIELNRIAHKYALENIKLNKLNNLVAIQGDVKKAVKKLKIKFDMSEINEKISEHAQKQRIVFDKIIMARPQLKETFLDDALKVSKKGTIIYYHDFLWEEKIEEKIKYFKKTYGKKLKLIGWKKIGDISPRKYRIRIEFKVL